MGDETNTTKKKGADAEVWRAWTDGAAIENPGAAGLGFVLVSPDGVRREGYQGLGTATNNVAELTAILRVAELTPVTEHLVVHTDSKYAIGVLQQNWKATKNIELIERTKAVLAAHASFSLEWVKGHSTNLENNVADKLSCRAAEVGWMESAIVAIVSTSESKIFGVMDPGVAVEVVEEKTELLLVMPAKAKRASGAKKKSAAKKPR